MLSEQVTPQGSGDGAARAGGQGGSAVGPLWQQGQGSRGGQPEQAEWGRGGGFLRLLPVDVFDF